MRSSLFIAAASCLFAQSALAQTAAPYKLVVAWSVGGVTVIDYPNATRCAAALRALEAEAERRQQKAAERAALNGAALVGSPWTVYGVCIPG
jgi:hypothetical protein